VRPLDQRERDELCDLLLELGPDAPTLCEGWTTLDLAAHLVVREREPRTAPGLVSPRFAAYTDRRRRHQADQGLAATVDRLRSGPPLLPWGLPKLRTLLNLVEFTVHHEDVRRANGAGPRTERPDLDDALWKLLRGQGRLGGRHIQGAGLDLLRPDHPGSRLHVKSGSPLAELTGAPIDLVLYLSGRKDAAQVTLTGPADAVAAVRAARMGV
jgi:uncharacterized protein (TIGR03085 family)